MFNVTKQRVTWTQHRTQHLTGRRHNTNNPSSTTTDKRASNSLPHGIVLFNSLSFFFHSHYFDFIYFYQSYFYVYFCTNITLLYYSIIFFCSVTFIFLFICFCSHSFLLLSFTTYTKSCFTRLIFLLFSTCTVRIHITNFLQTIYLDIPPLFFLLFTFPFYLSSVLNCSIRISQLPFFL